jgi:hypothetical protein
MHRPPSYCTVENTCTVPGHVVRQKLDGKLQIVLTRTRGLVVLQCLEQRRYVSTIIVLVGIEHWSHEMSAVQLLILQYK